MPTTVMEYDIAQSPLDTALCDFSNFCFMQGLEPLYYLGHQDEHGTHVSIGFNNTRKGYECKEIFDITRGRHSWKDGCRDTAARLLGFIKRFQLAAPIDKFSWLGEAIEKLPAQLTDTMSERPARILGFEIDETYKYHESLISWYKEYLSIRSGLNPLLYDREDIYFALRDSPPVNGLPAMEDCDRLGKAYAKRQVKRVNDEAALSKHSTMAAKYSQTSSSTPRAHGSLTRTQEVDTKAFTHLREMTSGTPISRLRDLAKNYAESLSNIPLETYKQLHGFHKYEFVRIRREMEAVRRRKNPFTSHT